MKASDICAVVFVALSSDASPGWAQVPGPNNAITDVPGIRVGHFTGNPLTGTTVVIAEKGGQGVAGGVSQRGGAPGTRHRARAVNFRPRGEHCRVQISDFRLQIDC